MFRIFIVIFILSISFYLYKDYSEIMELKTTHQEWAEIIKVEERDTGSRGGMNWLVTVNLSNARSVNVSVIDSPVPKVGDCMFVTFGIFATGGILAVMHVDKWRYEPPRSAPC